MQYLEHGSCPDAVRIPTEDGDAYRWYPAYKWVYNKLSIAESQGLECGPHGIDPPDPEVVGERWRDMWLARFDALQPVAARWMSHPWRTGYWKHGSVCEDLEAIDVPVYAIGGWTDGYSSATSRTMALS